MQLCHVVVVRFSGLLGCSLIFSARRAIAADLLAGSFSQRLASAIALRYPRDDLGCAVAQERFVTVMLSCSFG